MEFIDPNLLRYAEAHTSAESEILKKINRETHLQVLRPNMLSGHLQGRFLAMISQMISPKVILEIGTYTGYSAICLAEGLQSNGKLITIDRNEELYERVTGYFQEAGVSDRIDYRIGNALDLIPEIQEVIDLVFIDADKANNGAYFDLVIDRVRTGGYILADNVLWKGRVLDEAPDKYTIPIVEFNQKIQLDGRVENVTLPIRDGLLLMRKVKDR
jgi:caffeoyl-CoA O-methyltransferase